MSAVRVWHGNCACGRGCVCLRRLLIRNVIRSLSFGSFGQDMRRDHGIPRGTGGDDIAEPVAPPVDMGMVMVIVMVRISVCVCVWGGGGYQLYQYARRWINKGIST